MKIQKLENKANLENIKVCREIAQLVAHRLGTWSDGKNRGMNPGVIN